MAYFDVVLQTEASLHPYAEPSDFITEYTGLLRYQRNHDGRIFRIGKVHAYRVHAALATDHGESLFDVCDAHSQELHDVYAAVFDHEQEGFRDDLVTQFDAADLDCLVLDYVILHPRWRGLRLGLLAVRKMVDLLGGGCGLAVAAILPLRSDAYEALGVPADWLPRHETSEVRKQVVGKLRRHFKKMGFRRIRGTPYHGLSLAQRTPRAADLLRPPAS
jgi:hypothetical protein